MYLLLILVFYIQEFILWTNLYVQKYMHMQKWKLNSSVSLAYFFKIKANVFQMEIQITVCETWLNQRGCLPEHLEHPKRDFDFQRGLKESPESQRSSWPAEGTVTTVKGLVGYIGINVLLLESDRCEDLVRYPRHQVFSCKSRPYLPFFLMLCRSMLKPDNSKGAKEYSV